MSDFKVDVHTEIPTTQFKVLRAAAAKHKTTVGALVAELVRRGLTPGGVVVTAKRTRGKPTPETRQKMLDLYRAGLVDADIADRIGMSKAWVCLERKMLELPSNGRKPKDAKAGPYR